MVTRHLMRWLVALSLVLLVAALAYALWPVAPETPAPFPSPAEAPTPSAVAPSPPTPPARPSVAAPSPAPPLATAPVPVPAPPPGAPAPAFDPRPLIPVDVDPEGREPLDAGVLHALTRDGIRGAIQEKLPEIKQCYEAWLTQNPSLAGKLKVDFRIAELPGFERGRVSEVTVLDGGFGHVAMEGCVRNVFQDLRFERPERGEMHVTYPLTFSAAPPAP